MRLLRLSKLRRCPPPPPPPLHHFVGFYSLSSSSNPSFSSWIHDHHHNWQRSYNPGCSSKTYFYQAHNHVSFSRRFSTESERSSLEWDEVFFPYQSLISLLDYYHDLTGFPWWIIISTSTVAMRLALLPLIVVQLKKIKIIGELMPKLPPPFPPPLSGRSFSDQFVLFLKEKKAAGGPSLLWFAASFSVQVPCFFLWVVSIRRMSLDHHPGFDSGGMLWFQNLTEYSHGVTGLIFPLCIAGLHLTNNQISLPKSSVQQIPGSFGLLAKAYKRYLQLLTLPILVTAFNIPQGSLVYWFTNSTFTLIQLVCLHHPNVIKYLGLPARDPSEVAPTVKEISNSGVPDVFILTKEGEISAQSLSAEELVPYAIKVLTEGRKDTAIALLRVALDKDPAHVRALLIMGQTLLQKNQIAEAAECLENGVSKLLVNGYPTEVEEVDLLILSSIWAGMTNVKQGKLEEGLVHLERIAELEEPEDSMTKAHYYDGLLVLSSALTNVGRRAEALKHLQKAVAYNPSYSVYIEQLQTESKDLGDDLSNTGRYL